MGKRLLRIFLVLWLVLLPLLAAGTGDIRARISQDVE